MFGKVIDSSCVLQKASSCSTDQGACLLYDRGDLRYKEHGLLLGIKVLAGLLYLIPWSIARRQAQRALVHDQSPANGTDGITQAEHCQPLIHTDNGDTLQKTTTV